MVKTLSIQEMSAFRYQTCIGPNDETLYHAPIEIESKADLDNYGISWDDCRTISFGGTDPRTVYFFWTSNRELAEEQWRWLNRDHSAKVALTRCMIPGTRKVLIRCPTCNSCARCPYGKTFEEKQLNTISWEQMQEAAGNGEDNDNACGSPTEELGDIRLMIDEVQRILDEEDERLMKALRMKELLGFTIPEIAEELKCSEPRIYQLIAVAKKKARKILEDNE